MSAKPLRIGITGTTGRLGNALLQACRAQGHTAIALPHSVLDLQEQENFARILDPLHLDALINPAALTDVDACEGSGAQLAHTINALAPQALAQWSFKHGVRFIHLSTDYVFSGKEQGLKTETDATEPIQIYGQSKLAGERAVLEASAAHLVARVSWIYGGIKASFLESAIRRAQNEEDAGAIANKWSMPLLASEGAQLLVNLISHPEAKGILHLCHEGEAASWLDWAQEGLNAFIELGYPVKTNKFRPQQVEQVPFFKAPRPIHTAMSTKKLSQLLGTPPSPWRQSVREFILQHAAQIYTKNP